MMHRTTLENYKMTDNDPDFLANEDSSKCGKESSECDKETSHITELVLFGGHDDLTSREETCRILKDGLLMNQKWRHH